MRKRFRYAKNIRAKIYLGKWLKKFLPKRKKDRGAVSAVLDKKKAFVIGMGCLDFAFDEEATGQLEITIFLRDVDSEKGATITLTTLKKILDK